LILVSVLARVCFALDLRLALGLVIPAKAGIHLDPRSFAVPGTAFGARPSWLLFWGNAKK
jgi:hypothetical protein